MGNGFARLAVGILALAACGPVTAVAQVAPGAVPGAAGSAPDRADRLLEGVTQAVVMAPEMGAGPSGGECGLTADLVSNAVIGPVIAAGLRTERIGIAQPFTVNTPGVYLIPTVATLREGPYTCVSWVALRAQSAQPVSLPSTGLFKNAQVIHWDRGLLLSSNAQGHPEAVSNAVQQLAAAFGQQWRNEQR